MIDDLTFARARRLFFAEHLGIKTIARQLGVHSDVVRRAISSDAFNQRKAVPARPSLLDPYKPFVVEQLGRYPRLRATRVHDMIRQRGYAGSVVMVRRFIASVRGRRAVEAFGRRTTLAGEEAQVDWAHFGKLRVGRAQRPLMAFVMVLGFCRALFVRFFHDLTNSSFLEGHVRAFEAFGGVPRRILYDNLKSVVIERNGDAIRFSDDILHLAAHYHFEPRPCAPYRGNEKGKVERAIRYLRESFFAARVFGSLEELHAQLAAWIDSVALARIVAEDPARRTVAVLLAEERPRLLPLPPAAFCAERTVQLASGKTPYLRFDLNDYSIPPDQVGVPLVLRASHDRVRILDASGFLIVAHPRSFDAGERIEHKPHLEALHATKRHAREHRGRDALIARCPAAAALLGRQLDLQLNVPAELRALGLLCERFGNADVDAAIVRCLGAGLARATDVERVLLQPHAAIDPDPVSLDLSGYDHLAPPKDSTP
jgi:transposase